MKVNQVQQIDQRMKLKVIPNIILMFVNFAKRNLSFQTTKPAFEEITVKSTQCISYNYVNFKCYV